MARDLSLLMQTEVAEAFEPAAEGRGVSSTMPQKRNPVAAAMALAAGIGRPRAHELVEQASRRARETGMKLQDVLGEDPAVSQHLSPRDLAAVFEPRHYLGQSVAFIDRVLAQRRRRREAT